MPLSFFFVENSPAGEMIAINEETSKHISQVLRMKIDEEINLTDGKGNLYTATIIENHKKKTIVKILDTKSISVPERKITIAISLIKNSNRFEWFLEKATEIGVAEIIPLHCQRTEKQHFRLDRMKSILVSAMLQSRQVWLPVLHEPVAFSKLFQSSKTLEKEKLEDYQQRFIAHCVEDEKRNLTDLVNEKLSSKIILIGPEGDFTPGEIELALQYHFSAVSLGETRLRTETAGIVSAVLLNKYKPKELF